MAGRPKAARALLFSLLALATGHAGHNLLNLTCNEPMLLFLIYMARQHAGEVSSAAVTASLRERRLRHRSFLLLKRMNERRIGQGEEAKHPMPLKLKPAGVATWSLDCGLPTCLCCLLCSCTHHLTLASGSAPSLTSRATATGPGLAGARGARLLCPSTAHSVCVHASSLYDNSSSKRVPSGLPPLDWKKGGGAVFLRR